MKKILLTLSFFVATLTFAANPSEISAYKAGDSMAWYHELIRDAYNPQKMSACESTILEAMKSPEMSDESFRLCCKILKACATEKSLDALQKHFSSKNRVSPIFDVFVACELPKTDEILLKLAKSKNSDVALRAITVLGVRKNTSAINAIVGAATDKESANVAAVALSKIPSRNSAAAITSLSKKADEKVIQLSLEALRENLLKSKNKDEALKISATGNPVFDLYFACMQEGAFNAGEKGAMRAIDIAMSEEKSTARYAARFANGQRTFENSSELIRRYPKLSDGAKVAAIRSFALSKDSRFFKVIESDLESDSSDVSAEALYACEFIAPDSAIKKLVKILDVENNTKIKQSKPSQIAQYVLSRMPSAEVQKQMAKLYAQTKSPIALQILIERGTPKMKAELVNLYMANVRDKDLSKILSEECGYDVVALIAKKFNSADEATRKAALQQIVKFLSKERNRKFAKDTFTEYFKGGKLNDTEIEILETRIFNPPKKR